MTTYMSLRGVEDTKEVIRICKPRTDNTKTRRKRTNNELHNTHKTKVRVTRNTLKIGANSGAPEG